MHGDLQVTVPRAAVVDLRVWVHDDAGLSRPVIATEAASLARGHGTLWEAEGEEALVAAVILAAGGTGAGLLAARAWLAFHRPDVRPPGRLHWRPF